MGFDPDQQIGVVILSNSRGSDAQFLQEQEADLVNHQQVPMREHLHPLQQLAGGLRFLDF